MTSPPGAFGRCVQAAERYCSLVEAPSAVGDRAAFISGVRSALAELLASGLELPDTEPSDAEMPEGLAHQEWSSTFAKVQTVLGELPGGLEDYLAVPDDLADVWRDLRQGLNALRSGTSWEDVSWEWKFGLQTHWGKHAEDALVALHDA
jgi:hypothetical protein